MFFKVGVLKNFETYLKRFATFTEKNLCWSLFLIKLQAFRLAALLKRAYNTSCFHVNIAKLFKKCFFIEHLLWLLLQKPPLKVCNLQVCNFRKSGHNIEYVTDTSQTFQGHSSFRTPLNKCFCCSPKQQK